jgi:voltage-dependent potassium channel beta subunit
MHYRRLGNSGIQVSELGFGSWVTFGAQLDVGKATDLLGQAFEAGINFFDNAEVYAGGESERIMGKAIARLGLPRHAYIVTSKYFWGIHNTVNTRNTLNRKYLIEAVEGSLQRFGLDRLDIVYCHRPDPHTPISETVFTMHEIVSSKMAYYWGTSEWSADEIRSAIEFARQYHLHPPVVEQPEYNIFRRDRVEHEYKRLLEEERIGLTTWSPLASGLLTGKYQKGIPEGSRASLPGYEWLASQLTDPKRLAVVERLIPIASKLDASPAQLAIAWCLKNPYVSSVILGATSTSQLSENLGSIEVAARMDAQTMKEIEDAVSSFS